VTFEALPWDAGTYLTDVRMMGTPGFGAIYLIDEEKKCLVETGTSNDVAAIFTAIEAFGLKPADIDALVVSHVHLDHAGGAGFLLEKMPNAKVYVHHRGAKHLVDPSKLVGSAQDALREMAAEFGTMRPVRADRLVAVNDGDTLDLGGRVLRFLDSPGHAPHELTILDEKTRCVYTGDACGLYFPGDEVLLPITPPPSFDLEANLAVFTRLLALQPRALLYSHYGPHTDPKAALQMMLRRYPEWAATVRARLKEGSREEEIVGELFRRECGSMTRYAPEFMQRRIANSVHGLAVYHERMERAARA